MRAARIRSRVSRGLGLGLAILLGGTACDQPERPPDVLLLVVDTLRADRLSLYGHSRPTSPELDRFAEDAIVFDPVVAPSSWTLPSVASLMTASYPSVHGLRSRRGSNKSTRMRPGLTTLAEVLSRAGYRTGGVVTNPWVNTEEHGLQRGFETYVALLNGRADAVHAKAREIFLSDDPRPLFLYLHYMDVHGPYPGRDDPSVPDLGPVAARYDRRLTPKEKKSRPKYLLFPGEKRLDPMLDAYDRSIRSWDRSFGELVRWLEETGRLESSVILIVSDHGEEFLEHGGWNHGLTLYEEQIRVPWVLRAPGEAGRRLEGVASLVDVGPTLLGLLGIPAPESMSGRDVLQVDPEGADRAVFSETHIFLGGGFRKDGKSLVAMRRGDRKWILHPRGDRCFDLATDPTEQQNLACDPDGVIETIRWAENVKLQGEILGENEEFEVSPEQRALLEELGYAN